MDVIFFFQAEDGIRDKLVTGVQTCALPIFVIIRVVILDITFDNSFLISSSVEASTADNASSRDRKSVV